MSDNSKLVQYFVNGFLNNSGGELVNLISTNFVYSEANGEDVNFDQFVIRMHFFNSSTTTELGEIKSGDDTHFHFDFLSLLPPPNSGVKLKGFIQIFVKKGLICRVDLHSEVDDENLLKFEDLMKNSKTALL
ncbi:MAG: hypothetical protein OCD03_13280 [Hyphomicrobiales bacterium]